jgi:hypothetical protein
MSWWTWVWIGLMVLITIGGAWDDHRDRRGPLVIGLSIASGLISVAGVLAFYLPAAGARLGKALLPLSVLAGVLLVTEMIRDLRAFRRDPEPTAREKDVIEAVIILVVGLMFGPAVLMGIASGIRHW